MAQIIHLSADRMESANRASRPSDPGFDMVVFLDHFQKIDSYPRGLFSTSQAQECDIEPEPVQVAAQRLTLRSKGASVTFTLGNT